MILNAMWGNVNKGSNKLNEINHNLQIYKWTAYTESLI